MDDLLAALDFDMACTIRLQFHDLESAEVQAKMVAFEVGKMFFGSDDGPDE